METKKFDVNAYSFFALALLLVSVYFNNVNKFFHYSSLILQGYYVALIIFEILFIVFLLFGMHKFSFKKIKYNKITNLKVLKKLKYTRFVQLFINFPAMLFCIYFDNVTSAVILMTFGITSYVLGSLVYELGWKLVKANAQFADAETVEAYKEYLGELFRKETDE